MLRSGAFGFIAGRINSSTADVIKRIVNRLRARFLIEPSFGRFSTVKVFLALWGNFVAERWDFESMVVGADGKTETQFFPRVVGTGPRQLFKEPDSVLPAVISL